MTLRQLMGHGGCPNDGGDEGPLFTSAASGRSTRCSTSAATSANCCSRRDKYRHSSYGWISQRGRRSRRGRAVPQVHAEPDLRTAGHARHGGRLRDGSDSGRATPYFPRFAADPRYGPDLMRPIDYSCYAGSSVFLSTPSDLVRFGSRSTAASCCSQPPTITPDITATGLGAGDRIRSWLGTRDRAWRVNKRARSATTESRWAERWRRSLRSPSTASSWPSPRTSLTRTRCVALKIAQAFAEPGRSRARK